jgi:hypothetical protein
MQAFATMIAALLLLLFARGTHAGIVGERMVTGGAKAELLYREARAAAAGSWEDGFSKEQFTRVGTISTEDSSQLQIGFLSTVWGPAGRATNRLLIFSEAGKYLGRFSGFSFSEPPSIASATVLLFPVRAEHGNVVLFKAGIPDFILIDGERHEFEPANQSLERTSASWPRYAACIFSAPRGQLAAAPQLER